MRLLILVPSRGSISLHQRDMLHRLHTLLKDAGHHLAFKDNTIPGILSQSRETLLACAAGQPEGTCNLWLDADVSFDPNRIIWAMGRPEDVIVWNYPVRISWDWQYPPEQRKTEAMLYTRQPFRLWTGPAGMRTGAQITRSRDGRLVELAQCGLGAALMSTRVAREMHETFGPHQSDGYGMLSRAFQPIEGATRCSEDVSFWRRYTSLGHRIWCDPVPYVTNGESGGCFADEIRRREETLVPLCLSAAIAV
jgi:hypothetical protein